MMKVGVLHSAGDLRFDEVEKPRAGPGDIVIKVAAAGICGTDLHFRNNGPRFAGKPMPLGHEFAGEVVEVGPNVKSYHLGERVAYNSNNSPADMGRGGECGGFSEYVILREVDDHVRSLCHIPDNVSFDHAALVEPISVGAHAVNRAEPKPGESVTIFGVGPIGLGIVAALKERGIDDIVAFDLSPLRRERAMSLGARAAFDPRDRSPVEVLSELRGQAKVWGVDYPKTDIYFEVSGAKGLLAEIAAFANKRTRIIVVAMQNQLMTFDASRLMSKEVSLIGASGYPTEFPEVMAKLASGKMDAEAMITHRLPFTDFLGAFEIANHADTAAKVVLTFD
jgi:2-desacetyl-2-hydroxyethyl bacteriochlorophyllide A dehydrogenase